MTDQTRSGSTGVSQNLTPEEAAQEGLMSSVCCMARCAAATAERARRDAAVCACVNPTRFWRAALPVSHGS
eukprot:6742253-Prymnesium_polylepis.1